MALTHNNENCCSARGGRWHADQLDSVISRSIPWFTMRWIDAIARRAPTRSRSTPGAFRLLARRPSTTNQPTALRLASLCRPVAVLTWLRTPDASPGQRLLGQLSPPGEGSAHDAVLDAGFCRPARSVRNHPCALSGHADRHRCRQARRRRRRPGRHTPGLTAGGERVNCTALGEERRVGNRAPGGGLVRVRTGRREDLLEEELANTDGDAGRFRASLHPGRTRRRQRQRTRSLRETQDRRTTPGTVPASPPSRVGRDDG